MLTEEGGMGKLIASPNLFRKVVFKIARDFLGFNNLVHSEKLFYD